VSYLHQQTGKQHTADSERDPSQIVSIKRNPLLPCLRKHDDLPTWGLCNHQPVDDGDFDEPQPLCDGVASARPQTTRQAQIDNPQAIDDQSQGGAGSVSEFTIRYGSEAYPNCSMLEVNPLADVPRTNLIRVGKRFKTGRKPTDTEDSTGYRKRDFVFV